MCVPNHSKRDYVNFIGAWAPVSHQLEKAASPTDLKPLIGKVGIGVFSGHQHGNSKEGGEVEDADYEI